MTNNFREASSSTDAITCGQLARGLGAENRPGSACILSLYTPLLLHPNPVGIQVIEEERPSHHNIAPVADVVFQQHQTILTSLETEPITQPLPFRQHRSQPSPVQIMPLKYHLQTPTNDTPRNASVKYPSPPGDGSLPLYMILAYPPSPTPTTQPKPDGLEHLAPPSSQPLQARERFRDRFRTWSWNSILGTAAAISTVVATVLVIIGR
ncbi:hypothetical protein DL93DRAFT_2101755 [Clavulina sp. PMI_390]|nr:hypothetical protein DL93DRAFT_2101755 [Clavulina sp. PMI_390]